MILLPTLPANTAENPVKTVGLAGLEGMFAAILAGETEGTGAEGGKILPEGGKDLPVELPETLAQRFGRKMLMPVGAKPAAKTPAAETPAAATLEATPETEPDTDTEEADAAPKADVLTVMALAMELPLQLDPAPLAPQPAPAVEPEGEIAEEAPARKLPMLPLSFPGLALTQETARPPEADAQPAETRPGRHAPMQAAQALLAALRQPADTAAKQPSAEPAIAPEQALAAVAAPTVAQETARPARASRPQLRREVTLELAKQAKASTTVQPAANAAVLPTVSAMQAVAPDAAAPTQGAKATEFAASNQPVRPHEFAALVDRLVEARESVRPANANLTVMHADFGRVSMHFGQDNGNLTVSLANSDPGFVPAVNAAVAADASNGDSTFQGSRREDGGQASSSRSASENHSGERSSGREDAGRNLRDDRIKPQPQFASQGGREPRGGIFA